MSKNRKSKNKYYIATLAGTVAASSVVAPSFTEAAGKSFPDVKADDYFSDAVSNLVDRGLVKGFPDGTFKPYSSLTRGQAAVILAGALELDTKNVKNPNFKDISTTHPYYGAIAALANAGYIKGFEDGSYGAGKSITRNHMAIILAKAFELKASTGATTPFTDIYPDYKGYITALYENGITTGNTKTTFGGLSNVTRGQFAEFLLRAEKAKGRSVTFTVDSLSSSDIQTSKGKLTFDTSLKSIFSTKNAAALKNAEMTATVKDGKIIEIKAITLNAEGKESAPAVFDGGNEIITGDVIVNADYVALNNLKVKGNITLTGKVAKGFSSDGLVTEGEIIINEAESNPVASLITLFAAVNEGPKVDLKNSSAKGIQVERNNITLNSDKKLPEVKVSATVSSIEVNADVEKIRVNVSGKLELNGSGTIGQVDVQKAIELALKVTGQVKELNIETKNTLIELGVNLLIEKMVVPLSSKIDEIISNYHSVKDKIKNIQDEKGSTVTPVTPPSSGGSSGGSDSQVKRALINTANEKLAAIPEAATITEENKATVKEAVDAAQLAISAAKNAGAVDTDFVGLDKIQKALEKIQKIESPKDLIISEYVEGSSTNKAIEIYNGTGKTIDLSQYSLDLYANSGDTGSTVGGTTKASASLKLESSLKNGETYVLYNSTDAAIIEKGNFKNSSVINFNGNDQIVLKKGDNIVDSIGRVGSAEQFAKDVTLVRKSTVYSGDTNPDDDFDPSLEWDAYPKDDFSYLGKHTIGTGSTPVENSVGEVNASITPGSVKEGTKITLSTDTEGATIYYTTDGSEPTTSSEVYSEPITVTSDMTIKAIAVKDELENSEVATFQYSLLQEKSIAEVRNLPKGSNVMTSGVVTAVIGLTTFIQDDNAGIVLYGSNLNVEPGDRVKATGELTEYSSLLEINVKPEDVTVLEKVGIPAAKQIQASELAEEYEGTLVTVKNVTINSYSGGNYIATDDSGAELQLRPSDAALLETNKTYESITAVVGAYNNNYQLIPRNAADIIFDSSIVQTVSASPSSGLVKVDDKITLSTATEGATIYYTVDGSEPTKDSLVYSEPITITEDTTVKAIAVKEDLTDSEVSTFEYIIQKEEINIHDIQGEGHYSKYADNNVTGVDGIVTHIVDKNNFYMQDLNPDNNSKTSEGILVYKKDHGLKSGDVVTVDGVVKEWFIEGYAEMKTTDLPVTEINATKLERLEENHPLPEPVILGENGNLPTEIIDNDGLSVFDPEEDGIDFYESLEGMLVAVKDPKVVALQKYGELTVIPGTYETNTDAGGLRITSTDYNPERITINIDDEKYEAKMGDYFTGTIDGVVSYGYGYYQVLSDKSKLPALQDGGNKRETTTIVAEDDKLTVASYNVENFASTANAEKVRKLAEAVVTNMKTPDIIGLTEVQDNDGETDSGTVDASQSAQVLIDKIVALDGPEYVYTDVAPVNNEDGGAPGGNIRVGFLYNPDRVTLTEGTKGTSKEAVGFDNGSLTLNPGRIDPTNTAFEDSRKPLAAEFMFKGEKVIVIANHFNSKGGDQPLYGQNQPAELGSEVQRMKIAGIVNGFVKEILTEDPNANVVLTGDFNDFEFSNPLKTLKGSELTNMIELVPEQERYSYSYQGNAQVLDHILVSNSLQAATTVDIVHINSGFMEVQGRASDHDPVMIQIDFAK